MNSSSKNLIARIINLLDTSQILATLGKKEPEITGFKVKSGMH